MLPEVQVLLERARSARLSLDGLLDVLPADYWRRAKPGARWNVRDQLAHMAAADDMLGELLGRAVSDERVVWLGGTEDPAELLIRREAPLAEMSVLSLDALRNVAAEARDAIEPALAMLTPAALEVSVFIAGAVARWGEPLRWDVRQYLAAWATHDSSHEASIRAAIATTPDLSTVALTQRRR